MVKEIKDVFYLIICIPIFLECIDSSIFEINIPLPYSLATTFFILIGWSLLLFNNNLSFNKIMVAFLFIYLSIALASFVNNNFNADISNSIGSLIKVIAAIGFANSFNKYFIIKIFSFFCILNFIYWFVYVVYIVNIFENLESYSMLFNEGNVANHHIVGLAISSSSIFLLYNYFIKNNFIQSFGYILIILTMIILFLTESRSNLIVYALIILYTLNISSKLSYRFLLFSIISFFSLYYFFDFAFSTSERLDQKFSFDENYQISTNYIRLEILKRFPSELFSNILGKGVNGGTIYISFKNYVPHNQFIAFTLQGGIISLLFCLRILFNLCKSTFQFKNRNHKIYPLFIFILSYFITLLTVDQGGLMFYIVLSITFFVYDPKNRTLLFKSI
jgi:hypothetical protein